MPRLSAAARRSLQDERRAQILSAASRVFAHKGFERATMGAIAAEAGLAAGSIYRYFRNKDDLLISIPRQFALPATQAFQSAMLADVPPEQALALTARTMLALARQNAALMRVMLGALPSMKPATRSKYLEQVPLFIFGLLEGYIRRQMRAGRLRADLNPPLAARAFAGSVFVVVLLRDVLGAPGGAFDDDAVADHAVRLFLDGARARPKGKR